MKIKIEFTVPTGPTRDELVDNENANRIIREINEAVEDVTNQFWGDRQSSGDVRGPDLETIGTWSIEP